MRGASATTEQNQSEAKGS